MEKFKIQIFNKGERLATIFVTAGSPEQAQEIANRSIIIRVTKI